MQGNRRPWFGFLGIDPYEGKRGERLSQKRKLARQIYEKEP